MQIPTLETDRLTLRPFIPADLDRLAKILADPDVMRYMPGGQPMSRERAARNLQFILDHWRAHGYGWWAVIPKIEGQLAGWCGLTYVKELDETEVAYLLGKAYWGRGIATEAAAASLRYAFETLKLDRVIALAHVKNVASQRVMQKNGMRFEKQIHLWDLDLMQYAVTRDTFHSQETNPHSLEAADKTRE